MLAQGTIFFSRNKHNTISLSSAKVEYRGAVNATTQCVWLQGILREIGVEFDSPIVIWCENKSEINIFTYRVQIQRTKHIEIHMHYIQSLVHDQVIALQYCPFAEQSTEILTK